MSVKIRGMFPPRQAVREPLPQMRVRRRIETKPQAVFAASIGRPGAKRAGLGQVAAERANALIYVTLRKPRQTGTSPARNLRGNRPGNRAASTYACRRFFSLEFHSQRLRPRWEKTETPASCPAELPVGNRRLRGSHQKATQGRRLRLRAARIVSVSRCFDHLTL